MTGQIRIDEMRRWIGEQLARAELGEGAPVYFTADQAHGYSCGQAAAYQAVLEFMER